MANSVLFGKCDTTIIVSLKVVLKSKPIILSWANKNKASSHLSIGLGSNSTLYFRTRSVSNCPSILLVAIRKNSEKNDV
jgi:hypothetical protein